MTLKLITEPVVEPVTLAEAKAHVRQDASDDDSMITAMIVTARQRAEHETGRALFTQTWERVLDAFPAYALKLGMPPVQSITSVTYIDAAGAQQSLASNLYTLDADTEPGFLLPAYGTSWPSTMETPGAVRVRFVAGYGAAAAAVPQAIRSWMLLQIGALYRNREAFAAGQFTELPTRFTDSLLDRFRVVFA